jgi:predicted Zn-dependent protease
MVDLFEILRRESARDPGSVEVFFSTHPPPQDRIARLQTEVARRRGGTRDTNQFQQVRARLLKMPPPQSMPRR